MLVLNGRDGKWYAIRVAELKDWFKTQLGPPSASTHTGPPVAMDKYAGRKGILALKLHYQAPPGESTAEAGRMIFGMHLDLPTSRASKGRRLKILQRLRRNGSGRPRIELWGTRDAS